MWPAVISVRGAGTQMASALEMQCQQRGPNGRCNCFDPTVYHLLGTLMVLTQLHCMAMAPRTLAGMGTCTCRGLPSLRPWGWGGLPAN